MNFIAGGAKKRAHAFLVSIAIIRVGNTDTVADMTLQIPGLMEAPGEDNTSAHDIYDIDFPGGILYWEQKKVPSTSHFFEVPAVGFQACI